MHIDYRNKKKRKSIILINFEKFPIIVQQQLAYSIYMQ